MIYLSIVLGLLLVAQHIYNERQRDRDRAAAAAREISLLERLHSATESHRGEIAQLNQARIEETSNLLQRIQAPEQAVASHVADTAPPDPTPVNLMSDDDMIAAYEERLGNLGIDTNAIEAMNG